MNLFKQLQCHDQKGYVWVIWTVQLKFSGMQVVNVSYGWRVKENKTEGQTCKILIVQMSQLAKVIYKCQRRPCPKEREDLLGECIIALEVTEDLGWRWSKSDKHAVRRLSASMTATPCWIKSINGFSMLLQWSIPHGRNQASSRVYWFTLRFLQCRNIWSINCFARSCRYLNILSECCRSMDDWQYLHSNGRHRN